MDHHARKRISRILWEANYAAQITAQANEIRRHRAFYYAAALFLALILLRPAAVNSREDVINLQTELKSLLPSGPVSDPGEFVRGGII